ncbi:MAG: hypothetical protein LC109_05945 [Bacteroidia bacterium]|nr:hypothetical protein [Bacteroidia bacterium]
MTDFKTYYNSRFREDINRFFSTIPDASRFHEDTENKQTFSIQYERLTPAFDHFNFLDNIDTGVLTVVGERPVVSATSSPYVATVGTYFNINDLTETAVQASATLDNFVLTTPGTVIPVWSTSPMDSIHALEARAFLGANFSGMEDTAYFVPDAPVQADISGVRVTIQNATNSVALFSNQLSYKLTNFDFALDVNVSHQRHIMGYPAIDIPVYEFLAKISPDFIVPNFHKVEENSLTLLELNPRFINSFFVGMNHEMSREMLWRKYPTDMRGSYFRKFWKNTIPTGETDPVELNKYRDISPIHGWGLNDDLDDNRKPGVSPTSKPLVMVIRGELIEQFPHVNIYAQQAQWNLDTEDEIIATEPRIGASTKIDPIFYGYLEPDVMLVGFDLTEAEAKGTWGEEATPTTSMDPGWFFVLEERAGDTRFGAGMPEGTTGWQLDPDDWTKLHWGQIANRLYVANKIEEQDIDEINFIDVSISLNSDNIDDYDWAENAANMGMIFCRNATKVLIHASNMLNQTT